MGLIYRRTALAAEVADNNGADLPLPENPAPPSLAAALDKMLADRAGAVAVLSEARNSSGLPPALSIQRRDPDLEARFRESAELVLRGLPNELRHTPSDLRDVHPDSNAASGSRERRLWEFFQARAAAMLRTNRLADGSVVPLEEEDYLRMEILVPDTESLLARARRGVEILRGAHGRSRVAGAMPLGGASTRANTWVSQNAEVCAARGITPGMPRFQYPLQGRFLAQITLENRLAMGQMVGATIPSIIMTNSEIAETLFAALSQVARSWAAADRQNTVLFNQIVLPRLWVEDGAEVGEQLYPAGHGNFPLLLAQLKIIAALKAAGVEYLMFSNGDEFMWGPDPVLLDIARELKDAGHGMLAVVVPNSVGQMGGGAVKDAAGRHMLVETPRLPWNIMCSGQAPLALNAAFYILSVEYLAAAMDALLHAETFLDVKTMPRDDRVQQVIGADSWAGDVFSALLSPRFLWWERRNYLGIKTPADVIGQVPMQHLGGRSNADYLAECDRKYPNVMEALINGNPAVARQLVENGYQYVEVDLG